MSDNLNTIGIRGKIAARTPDYRYTLPEGGNPGDIPVKTETGVEWQKPEPATTTPDWSQNDEAASDYIKNRPGGYTVNYPALNIEWDGVIGDRVVVDLGIGKTVKVSDETPAKEQIAAGRLTYLFEGEQKIADVLGGYVDVGVGCIWVAEFVIVINQPGIVADDLVFPETGTYFVYIDENSRAVSLALPAKSVNVPIPEKYIRQYILADDSLLDLTTDINMGVNLVIATSRSVKLKMNAETVVHVIAGNGICTVTDSDGWVAGFIPSGMIGRVQAGKSSISMFNQDYGIYKQIKVIKGESLADGISVGEAGVPVRCRINGLGTIEYVVNGVANDGDFVGIAILESGGTALLQTSGSMYVEIRTEPIGGLTHLLEPVTKADEGELVSLCEFNDSSSSLSHPRIVKYKDINNKARLAKILRVNETSGRALIWLY